MFNGILELTEIILQMESGNVTCNERINAIKMKENAKEVKWEERFSELVEKVEEIRERMERMDEFKSG